MITEVPLATPVGDAEAQGSKLEEESDEAESVEFSFSDDDDCHEEDHDEEKDNDDNKYEEEEDEDEECVRSKSRRKRKAVCVRVHRPDGHLLFAGSRKHRQSHETQDKSVAANSQWDPERGKEMTMVTSIPLVRSIWNAKSGFKNVCFNGSARAAKRPWQAKTDYGKSLGHFASPEEAAAAYSKHLGFEVAERLAGIVEQEQTSMSSEDALRAAASEGLTLAPANAGSTPFRGVYKVGRGARSFLGRVHHDGKKVSLGCFKTAEEAALEVARYRRDSHVPVTTMAT